jgi:hypothetical protein
MRGEELDVDDEDGIRPGSELMMRRSLVGQDATVSLVFLKSRRRPLTVQSS